MDNNFVSQLASTPLKVRRSAGLFTAAGSRVRYQAKRRAAAGVWRVEELMSEALEPRTLMSGDFGSAFSFGGSDDGPGDDRGGAVVALPGGGVISGFEFRGTVDVDRTGGTFSLTSPTGRKTAAIARTNADGTVVWAYAFGGSQQDKVRMVKLDANGNVYITGSFRGTADLDPTSGVQTETSGEGGNRRSTYLIKLNADGSFAWANVVSGSRNLEVEALAVDATGNAFIAGKFEEATDFNPGSGTDDGAGLGSVTFSNGESEEGNAFVAKYGSDGAFAWASTFEGVNIGGTVGFSQAFGLALAGDGPVVVTGVFSGTIDFDPGSGVSTLSTTGAAANLDTFVVKLGSNGELVWAKRIGSAGGVLDAEGEQQEAGRAVAIDDSGNVIIVGRFLGAVDFNPGSGVLVLTSDAKFDGYVLKLTPAGDFVFAKKLGGASGSSGEQSPDGLHLDDHGNIYIAGSFTGSFDADPGTGTVGLTSTASVSASPTTDIFVMRLNANGSFGWAKRIGGAGDDSPSSLDLAPDDSVIISGTFSGLVDFNPGAATANLAASGAADVFVAKLLQTGVGFTTVSIIADEATAAEATGLAPANGATFRIVRTGSTALPLTVRLTRSGTALIGTVGGTTGDYTLTADGAALATTFTTVTIPAGQREATVVLTVRDDALVEPTETAIFTLAAGTGYGLSTVISGRAVTVSIADDEPSLTITATDNTAAEGSGANGGTFVISRGGNITSELSVPITFRGTALRTNLLADYTVLIDGTDGATYNPVTGRVTIPAGISAATLSVVVIDDARVEATETVILTLGASPTGAYALPVLAAARTATVSIADDEPVLSISAADDFAGEQGATDEANPGVFVISRSGSTLLDLPVRFSISGTAGRGSTVDYTLTVGGQVFTGTTLVIPAGQTSVTVTLTVNDDVLVEPTETAKLTLIASAAVYTLSPTVASRSATAVISDNEPFVTVEVIEALTIEGATVATGIVRFSRTGPTDRPLTLQVGMGGSAMAAMAGMSHPAEYVLTGGLMNARAGTVVIPAGASTVDVEVRSTQDTQVEPTETVIFTLRAAATRYTLGPAETRTATVSIVDDESVVSVARVDLDTTGEGRGADPLVGFVIRRNSTLPGSAPVITGTQLVTFAMSGTATRGTDYRLQLNGTIIIGNTVVIPDGESSVTLTLVPLQDTIVESTELASMRIATSLSYVAAPLASGGQASILLTDDEPVVSISRSRSSTQETGVSQGTFIITRTAADISRDMVVHFTVSGTATAGLDYMAFGLTRVTIVAGETTAEIDVRPFTDGLAEGDESVIVTLAASAGVYSLTGNPAERSTAIAITNEAQSSTADYGLSIINPASSTFSLSSGGPNFTLSGTVRNNGLAASGPLTATLYLASTRNSGATRFQIGAPLAIASVTAGGTRSVSVVTNPNTLPTVVGLTPGRYFFIIILSGTNTDGTNVNNTFVSLTNSMIITA